MAGSRLVGSFLLASSIYLLIAALRVAGAQALAKMSACDLEITIAVGSIVASIPLSSGVTLTDGVAVILTYLTLHSITRVLIKRSARAGKLAKARPRIVL